MLCIECNVEERRLIVVTRSGSNTNFILVELEVLYKLDDAGTLIAD